MNSRTFEHSNSRTFEQPNYEVGIRRRPATRNYAGTSPPSPEGHTVSCFRQLSGAGGMSIRPAAKRGTDHHVDANRLFVR